MHHEEDENNIFIRESDNGTLLEVLLNQSNIISKLLCKDIDQMNNIVKVKKDSQGKIIEVEIDTNESKNISLKENEKYLEELMQSDDLPE